MRYIITTFLILITLASYAQVKQRNLLGSRYTLENVHTSLVPQAEWKPYPRTPQAWQQALPDNILKTIVKKGKKLLQKNFYLFPPHLP